MFFLSYLFMVWFLWYNTVLLIILLYVFYLSSLGDLLAGSHLDLVGTLPCLSVFIECFLTCWHCKRCSSHCGKFFLQVVWFLIKMWVLAVPVPLRWSLFLTFQVTDLDGSPLRHLKCFEECKHLSIFNLVSHGRKKKKNQRKRKARHSSFLKSVHVSNFKAIPWTNLGIWKHPYWHLILCGLKKSRF